MNPPFRGPAERFRAWIVTGPLGHLWSALADLAVFAARQLAERLRAWSGRSAQAGGRGEPSE